MSLIQGTSVTGSTGSYQISRSLRFNSADSAYLSRTFAGAPTSTTIQTYSAWVKRGLLGGQYKLFGGYDGSAVSSFTISFETDNTFQINFGGSAANLLITTAVYRDTSAWYHVLVSIDTTQATAANRIKVYFNGTQVTVFSTANYPAQNANIQFALANANNRIGSVFNNTQPFNGYLTEINFIDGQALTPSSFGETDTVTGVWKPKKYTGTYGTNGFYLNFSDNSSTTTLGDDFSGNGNDWTTNNFSVTAGAGNDSLVDTPTPYGTDTGLGGEVRGNYATWNPIYKDATATTTATSNGNLDTTGQFAYSTIGFPSGKFYFECTVGSNNNQFIGVSTNPYATANLRAYNKDGTYYTGSGWIAYGATYTTNDIIGVAIDMDSQTIEFYKNGSSQGQKTSIGLSGLTIFPMLYVESSGSVTANFGQRPFSYTAPSGFKALVTTNLPTPTIEDGGEYFNTVLYTGNSSTQSITGVGFQPDWVWYKDRSVARDHGLFDVLRGATILMSSNNTSAEGAVSGVTSFDSDGFTLGSSTNGNGTGETYVAWNWKANGAGVSNTDGTITSTVSVSTTSGFSIVSYTGNNTTGATIGHGLGVAPSMIIIKDRLQGTGYNWNVYHASLGNTQRVLLDSTSAAIAGVWNSTSPTSTVFTLTNNAAVNGTDTYVAYCFAPISGYSAMSSFTGNGSADGPFIFTNHRPAFVLIKRTDTTSNWTILDFQREGYNVDNDPLYPNLNNVEGTTDLADLLSNGFKLRTTDASVNASGGTYIYMSLASNPFKYSLAR